VTRFSGSSFPTMKTSMNEFELKEDEKPYREWCVPAALIKERATVTLMSDHELEEMGPRSRAAISTRPPGSRTEPLPQTWASRAVMTTMATYAYEQIDQART
jgi:hypothetical protein